MTTKFTPAQIRFFLNASLSNPEGQRQATLLDQFLGFALPAGLRYRIEVLRRNLASSMAPVDAQVKEMYEAYRAAAGDGEGDEEEGAEAKRKLDEDLKEIDGRPIEFTGKLILATQLLEIPSDALAFLSVPGVMGEWLGPFTIDNLPAE